MIGVTARHLPPAAALDAEKLSLDDKVLSLYVPGWRKSLRDLLPGLKPSGHFMFFDSG
jgi:hypothetical protein